MHSPPPTPQGTRPRSVRGEDGKARNVRAWTRWCSPRPGAPPELLTSLVLSSLAPRFSMSSLRELVGPEM